MKYRQLTREERYMIGQLRRQGCSLGEMARLMGRDRSTIWREIRRNSCHHNDGAYRPSHAQERTNGRRVRSRRGSHYDPGQWARIEQLLIHEQWSPEQIANTLRGSGALRISYQTIYRHVRRDWRRGGSLYLQLRQRYRRRKRHYGPERRGKLAGKRMIDQRPPEVEARQQIGHWEVDTVQGASTEKPCIVTLVERVTGLILIEKVPNRTSRAVDKALVRAIARSPLPVKTITADNGTEFHGYRNIEAATGVTIYFARPHHPWERGTNENTNGLLRQYWPKGASMARLSQTRCNVVAHKLNTRPRKRHGYLSPLQRAA